MSKIILFSLFLLSLASQLRAAEPTIDFNRDIKPILSNNCFACHGPDGNDRKAGLRVDLRDGVVGKDGVIVPGKPEESALYQRVMTQDASELMPPPKTGKKLTPQEAQLLATWIKQGAKYSQHWSYVKPTRPHVPRVPQFPNFSRNAIDAFIAARLVQENLKPSVEADRATLIRRVALDLTGLPPSLEEIDRYLRDSSPNAYETMVDRFLAKPSFGEHWARMWLDLARYADSAGYADDPPRTIWAYRDYVIRSFNQNKKFDQFTLEQIAGDLLPDATPEQIAATAFHRNTMTNNEGGTNDEEFRNAAVVDRVNTTLAVWMGTSMACAQCHTHKYDPITQKEYFQFFAYLNNTADADRRDESPVLQMFSEEQKRKLTEWEAELKKLESSKPSPEVLAQRAAWEKTLPRSISWTTPRPRFLSWGDLPATVNDQGSILLDKSAKTDTYTVELPLESTTLTGLKLEVLPHEKLPNNGPGFSGGNFVLSQVSAMLYPPAGSGLKGRYVRIELPGKARHLMLAEVEVLQGKKNLARDGKARQSSTAYDGSAQRAIDGTTHGHYFEGKSVSHTDTEDNPWWEVDLQVTGTLDRLVIWRRTDGNAATNLTNYRITILDDQRKVVWEKSVQEHPKADQAFTLDGSRSIPFRTAIADYSQEGFDANFVLNNPQPKEKGWAIGGATGKSHELILLPEEPQTIPAGSRLVVTMDQSSRFPEHLIGHFRLSITGDAQAIDYLLIPAPLRAALALSASQRSPEQNQALDEYFLTVAPQTRADRTRIRELKKLLADIKPVTSVPVLRELPEGKRRITKVQYRGNFLELGDIVTEGVPAAFPPIPAGSPNNRLGMAKWLVSRDNPLTARVTVNRFWEQIFGTGIVRTSEEFGSQGELPSHPELLDWLAVEFSTGPDAWDIKKFLKLIVTSATYRQSSRVTPELNEADPDNRLLARGPRHRLPAETIRDQALAVSGLLSPKMYGPSVRPIRPSMGLNAAFGGGLDWQTSTGEDRHRRGIYTEWRRTSPYPSMVTFDAPSREACTLRRGRTNTPLQALVTLNDPVYVEAAQGLARRMIAAGKTPEDGVRLGFRLCLARDPSDKELSRLVNLFTETRKEYQADSKKAIEMATNPIGPAPAGMNVTDLAAWTVVGNVLLNLDEFLMRR